MTREIAHPTIIHTASVEYCPPQRSKATIEPPARNDLAERLQFATQRPGEPVIVEGQLSAKAVVRSELNDRPRPSLVFRSNHPCVCGLPCVARTDP